MLRIFFFFVFFCCCARFERSTGRVRLRRPRATGQRQEKGLEAQSLCASWRTLAPTL